LSNTLIPGQVQPAGPAAGHPSPQTVRAALADAVEQLRNDPWQGTPTGLATRPSTALLAFDQWGIVMDVIGERTATVVVLELAWAG